MNNNIRTIISSKIIIDNYALFWLTKGKLLFNTIADLFILARSIHISEKSLKSAYQIVSDFSDGKSDENLILGYDLQQFRVKYRDHNIFYPINPSKSVIDYLDELDLPTNVTYLNDILSLLFYVKSEDSSILIISENFVLKNILDRFIDKDLLPINIQFMFTYHFVLSLFTFCSLDFLQLDNFKKIYKIDYFKFNSMDYKIKTAIFESTEKNFLSLLLEKRDEMKKSIPLAHKLLELKKYLQIYDFFLCFNDSDRNYIENLIHMLNDHGVNPWYFREANRAGDEWKKKLTKVIDLTSSHVIVVGEEIGMVQKEEIALIENKSKYDQNLRIISLILTKPDESNNLPLNANKLHRINVYETNPDPIITLLKGLYNSLESKILNFDNAAV